MPPEAAAELILSVPPLLLQPATTDPVGRTARPAPARVDGSQLRYLGTCGSWPLLCRLMMLASRNVPPVDTSRERGGSS